MNSMQLSGLWLALERLRLGMPLTHLQHELGVRLQTLVSIEDNNKPVPGSWLQPLKRLGFEVPIEVAEEAPPPPALEPSPSSGALETTGLVEIPSEPEPSFVPPDTTEFTPLSDELSAEQSPSQAFAASSARVQVIASNRPSPSQVESALEPQPESAAELLETIVKYRLATGPRSGLSPFDVLSAILADVQQMGLEMALRHDDVRTAMQSLLRSFAR